MSDNSRHFINRYPRSCRRRKQSLQPCCFGNPVNYKGNAARSNIGVGIEKTWIRGKLCPVIAAVAAGNTDILQKLLASEFVCDHVHQRQKCLKLCEKLSPLHVVAKMGLLNETEILLSAKMNPNVLNHDGHTPLHIAVQKGDSLLVRLLLSHGADPNKFDRMKNTPLHTAASQGHLDIVRTLLGFNANVHQADSLGYLPIHMAARAGHFHIVHLLCSADDGCVSAEDRSGKQSLHLAAENGHVETVTALLDLFGASIDVKDRYGNSPFHTLVLKPHRPNVMRNAVYYYATAKAFVQFGAKWCEKNNDGKSVIDLARENMFLNILDLLQNEMGLPSSSEAARTIHVSTSSIENSPPPEVVTSGEICQNKEQTKPKSVKNIPIKFLGSKESKDGRKNKSESDDGQPKRKKSTTKTAKRVTFSLDDVIDDEKSSREFHSSSSLSDVVDNKAPLGYIGNMDNEIAVYSADEISMVDEAIPVFTPTNAHVGLTLPDVALTTDDVELPEKINTSSSEKVNTLSSEKINTSSSDENNTSSADVRISNSASNAAATTSSINKTDSNVDVVPNKMRQRNDIDLKSWNRTSSNVRNPGQLESPVDVLDVVLCDEDFFEDYTSDDQLDAPTDSGDDQLDAPPDFVQYKFPSIFIAGRTAEHVSVTPRQPEPDLADRTDSVMPKYFSLPTKQKVTVLEIKNLDEQHEHSSSVNILPKFDRKVDDSVVISTTKDVPKENELVLSSSLDSVNTSAEKQKIKKTKKKIKKKAVDGMDISLSEDTNSENLSQNIVLPQPTLVDTSEKNEITSDKVQNIGANGICESQSSYSLSKNEVSDEKTGRLPAANDLIKKKKSKSDVGAEEGDLKVIVGSESEGKVIRKKRRQRPVLVEVNNEGNENVEATEKPDGSQRRLVARNEEQIQNDRNKTNSEEHIFETKILSSQRKETDIDEDFDCPSIHSNNLPVKNPTSSKETNIDDDTIDDMNMKFAKRTASVKKSNSFKMAVDRSDFSDMTMEKPRIKPSSNKVKETDVDEIMEIDSLDSKSVEPNLNGFNSIPQPGLPGLIQVENHSTSSQNGIEASNSKNTVTDNILVAKNSLYSSENIDSSENVVVNTSALLTDFDENNDESSEDETSGEEYVLENETIEEDYALENTETCGEEYMLECTTSRMKLFTIKELNSEDAEEEEEEEVIEVKSEERGEVVTSENVEIPKEEVNWDDLDTSELHTKPINAKEMLDIHPIVEVEQADVKTCNAGTELCSPEEMPTKIEEILKKNAEILHENEKKLKEKEEIIEAICKTAGSSDLKENSCEKKSKTRIRSFLETSFDDIEPVLSVESFEGNGFEGGVISRTSIRTRRSKRMKSKERLMPDDAIKNDDFLHQQLPDIIKTAQGHDRRKEETNIDDFSPNADERGNDFESLDRRENKSLEIKKDENLSRQGIGRVSRGRTKQDDKKTSTVDPTTEKSTKTEFLGLDHTSTGVDADNLEESLVQSSSQLKKKKNWANYSFDNSVLHKETEKNATKKLVNISFESANTPAELLPSQAKNPPARTAAKPFDATGKPPLGRSVNIWAEKRESMRESQAALASRSSNVGETRTLIKPSITPPTIMSRSNQLNMSDDSISRSSLSSTMSSASSVMRRTGESDSHGVEFKRQPSSSPQTIGKRRSQKKKMRSLSESRSSHSTSDDVSMREVEVKPIHISDTQKTFQDAAFECITASLLNQPKVQTRKPVPTSSARDPNVVYTTGAYHPPVMVFRSGSGSGPENSGRAGNRGSLIVGEGKSESTF